MSGIIEKVKDVLHGNKDHSTTGTHTGTGAHGTHGTTGHTGTQEGTSGPHNSRLANAADPRVDSDRDGSHHTGNTGITGQSGYGTSNTGSSNAGPHNSNIANKLDPRVDSDRDGSHNTGSGLTGSSGYGTSGYGTSGHTGTSGYGSSNAGPHDSNMANKLDPRVDSDRDGSRNTGSGLTGNHGSSGYGSSNAGPHDSNLANKLDPRVDSDRDGSHNITGQDRHHVGAGVYTGTSEHTGSSGYGSSNAGPHNSNMANKLDPRVDSDRDGSRNVGTGNYSTGGSTNNGPHSSNLANKADPRVDSDLDSTGNRGGASTGGVFGASGSHATPGSGTAQNTAGPHNYDILNKLDPRVDHNAGTSNRY